MQEGPIDLIVLAEGPGAGDAHRRAVARFDGILNGLAAELPALRSDAVSAFRNPVAQAMARAVAPFRPAFITPMAAVAGAVADAVLAEMVNGGGVRRAYVNNGGDIALFLAPDEQFDVAIAARDGWPDRVRIRAQDPVRGIATSGWRGRSQSLGIADAVTVLARTAAEADAAATMIANAVNVDDAAVSRLPANQVRDDSDLGDRLVTVGVASLSTTQVARALDAGAACAGREIAAGRVQAAWLCLQGQARRCAAPLAQHADMLRPGPILQACAAPQVLRLAPLLAASGA